MPVSLFKILFKEFTSLKIVSYICGGRVYSRLKPLTVSHGRPRFVQLFSVYVSVLQKVFPEPLFKEIKLSSFLSYYIVLLPSSMYHFSELSQIVFFFIVRIPFLVWKLYEYKDLVCVLYLWTLRAWNSAWYLLLKGKDNVLDNFLYLMPSTVSGHNIWIYLNIIKLYRSN